MVQCFWKGHIFISASGQRLTGQEAKIHVSDCEANHRTQIKSTQAQEEHASLLQRGPPHSGIEPKTFSLSGDSANLLHHHTPLRSID